MEENKRNIVVLEATGVRDATSLIELYESEGYELIGTPTDFNKKIMFTMKKKNTEEMASMIDGLMKQFIEGKK